MMKNVLNLYYFCIYFKKRPKNDLVLSRFLSYTPQGLKTYQSCRRSFQVNSFRVLADSAKGKKRRGTRPKGKTKSPGQASARAAATSRTRKKPIRGQKVQLGPILERGNARGLLHSYLQRIPYLRGNTPN